MGRSGETTARSAAPKPAGGSPRAGAEADAEGGGEERRAAGGIRAGLRPEAGGDGEAGGAVGGGVEGLEPVDGLAHRRAVEALAQGREAVGDRRVGVGLAPERPGEDRAPALVAGEADAALGRFRAGSLGIADEVLELEAAGGLVVADRLDRVGRRLVAEKEAVGEAGAAGAGGAVAGDGDDEARGGEIVGIGGVALQRAAEGDERGLDVLRTGEAAQPVEDGLEGEGQAIGEELAQERAAGGGNVGSRRIGQRRRRRAPRRPRARARGSRRGGSRLFAGPAILGHLVPAGEAVLAGVGHLGVVEHEVQQEDLVGVGAAQVEAGADHADLVADAQAVAAGERVGALLVAGDVVVVGIVDDDELAAAVDQALAAIELGREQQPDVGGGQEVAAATPRAAPWPVSSASGSSISPESARKSSTKFRSSRLSR